MSANLMHSPGRTVAQVVNDPANEIDRSEAEAKFAAAERAPTLEASYALFCEGVAIIRKIDAREKARST